MIHQADMTTRALSSEDILEIRRIVGIWNVAEDEGAPEIWAGLFLSDGISEYGDGRIEAGHAALLEGARRRAADQETFDTSHWELGTPVVEPTEDGALMRHYFTTLRKEPDGQWKLRHLSERTYRLGQVDGRWGIAKRTVRDLPLGPLPDLSSSGSTFRGSADAHEVHGQSAAGPTLAAADQLEIRDLITRFDVAQDSEEGSLTAHWSSNVVITGAEDEAEAHSYTMVLLVCDGGGAIRDAFARRDLLRKTDGRWEFVERRVEPIGRRTP